MPKVKDESPESLKPYTFHGIEFNDVQGDEHIGTCPWCGRDKFSVNVGTGVWRCLICNEGKETDKAIKGGNAKTFIGMLHKRSFNNTPYREYGPLAQERKLLSPKSLMDWGLCKSIITGRWLLPAYDSEGGIIGLYQWFKVNGRMAFLPTPSLGIHLLGMNQYNPKCNLVYLLEGFWDSCSFWEILGMCKQDKQGDTLRLVKTLNREASLLSEESVLGLTSCQGFREQWAPMFQGKIVVLLGQNDHEKRMCGGCRKSYSRFLHTKCPACGSEEITDLVVPAASYSGMERIARLVSPVASQVFIYPWGPEGYDKTLPTGYDMRDLLSV